MKYAEATRGKRYLIWTEVPCLRTSHTAPSEVTICEWSPSRQLVKVRFSHGYETWWNKEQTEEAEIAEQLPRRAP